jgi:peptidoglycan/LPS O-acetylase OafA/YrhL
MSQLCQIQERTPSQATGGLPLTQARGIVENRRLQLMDLGRGAAILAVFLYHSLGISFNHYQPGWAPGNWFRDFNLPKSYLALLPLTWGWAGVSIFFVISGFCIHWSFRQRPDLGRFFKHRFFRIYPPYAVVLLFFGFVFPTTREALHSGTAVGQVVSHLFLVHNFGPTVWDGINPSFWTIAVEAQLYLLYPVFFWLVSKLGWSRSLIILAAIELGSRLTAGALFVAGGTSPPQWIVGSPLTYWCSWAVGARLAEACLRGDPLPFLRWSPVMLVISAVACTFVGPLSYLSFFLFSMAAVAAAARALNGTGGVLIRFPKLFQQHLRKAGVWSYSIYLLHQPLLWGIAHIGYRFRIGHPHPLQILIWCLMSWLPIVGVAGVCFRLLERPSINLARSYPKPAPTRYAFAGVVAVSNHG